MAYDCFYILVCIKKNLNYCPLIWHIDFGLALNVIFFSKVVCVCVCVFVCVCVCAFGQRNKLQ